MSRSSCVDDTREASRIWHSALLVEFGSGVSHPRMEEVGDIVICFITSLSRFHLYGRKHRNDFLQFDILHSLIALSKTLSSSQRHACRGK